MLIWLLICACVVPITIWAASWENQRSAYAKTKTQISFAVTAKLISAFVISTWIVQYLYFLSTKFQASSHLQWLHSMVCVRPGQNPHCWFSHVAAHIQGSFDFAVISDIPGLNQKLVHQTLLEELLFWTVKFEFPQKVVTLLLSLLPDQSYKVSMAMFLNIMKDENLVESPFCWRLCQEIISITILPSRAVVRKGEMLWTCLIFSFIASQNCLTYFELSKSSLFGRTKMKIPKKDLMTTG